MEIQNSSKINSHQFNNSNKNNEISIKNIKNKSGNNDNKISKLKLMKKISDNLKEFFLFEEQKEKFKSLNENLKNFSIEEYSKFFLVLSNTQRLLMVDSNSLNKDKDFIKIDNKLLNYDENNRIFNNNNDKDDFTNKNEGFLEINKFIFRKELSLNAIIKEKLANNSINSNTQENFQNSEKKNSIYNNNNLKINIGKEKYLYGNGLDNINNHNRIDNADLIENLVKNLQSEFVIFFSKDIKNKIKSEFKGLQESKGIKEIKELKGVEYKILINSYSNNNINKTYENLNNFPIKNQSLDLDLNEYNTNNSNSSEKEERENVNYNYTINNIIENENENENESENLRIEYINKLKGIIKLNITNANTNNYYKIEKEDTIILDFIFEYISNKDLFNILKFWLYQEYLTKNENESLFSLRRYDNILNEISNRIEKNEENIYNNIDLYNSYNQINPINSLNYQNDLFKFLTNLPNMNEKSLDLFTKNYQKSLNLLELNFYNINNIDNLPNFVRELEKKEDNFLSYVLIIYKKLKKKLEFNMNINSNNVNQILNINNDQIIQNEKEKEREREKIELNRIALKSNYLDLIKKIRSFILNFNHIDNKNIIQKRIRFISEKIIPLKIDDEEIHKYSLKQFESLMRYNEDPINEVIVFGKYSLFFFLSLNYREEYLSDFIKECPKIYSNCSRAIKNEIDKKIEKNFISKIFSYENTRDLIRNCDENSYEIILMVIRSIKSDCQIERFSSEILNYYLKNGELKEIMSGMTNNIYTFFYICNDKLKIMENNINNFSYLENIFNEINTNASNEPINYYIKKDLMNVNSNELIELMEKIKDKVIFYILFFIQEFIIRKNIPLNKLNSFMKLFEKISNNGINEKLNDNIIYLIDLIKFKKTSEYNFFQIINYFLDFFSKSKNMKNIISSKIFILFT
jgi:hypothetical protein